ncbi:MAG: cation transporter, partial [Longimicrobiales bacterium]|nr:cation transporter [Longimicrobiales bacterium]
MSSDREAREPGHGQTDPAGPAGEQPAGEEPGHAEPGHTEPAHGHAPDHAHGAGATAHAREADRRTLLIVISLTGLFMVAELVGGIVSGSLALLADAAHMFTDVGALA